MRVIAGVFAVSVIAIVSVIPARAEVVSTELLDKRLGTNGNLAAVAHTGSYNDLTNKPTIPAAQVQTDWNATSGMGAIKNKPTLGTLAGKSAVTAAEITDGTITTNDISATAGIKKEQLAADVQTSLDKADTALQAHQDISGKEDKSNIVKSTEALDTLKNSEDRYPSMAAANKIAQTHAQAAVNGAINKYATKAALTEETSARTSADTALGTRIDNEVTARTSGDNAINTKIGTVPTGKTVVGMIEEAQDAATYDDTAVKADIKKNADAITAINNTDVMKSGATKAKIDAIATNTTNIGTNTAAIAAIKTEQGTQNTKISALESGKQDKLGYTAENAANKTITISAAADASDTLYPSEKAVATALAGKQGMLKAGSNISIAADGTISATDTNTTYGAAGNELGLVKSGGVATVSGGQITAVSKATNADNATNATTATNAKKICSGSTCTAFVDIWVE